MRLQPAALTSVDVAAERVDLPLNEWRLLRRGSERTQLDGEELAQSASAAFHSIFNSHCQQIIGQLQAWRWCGG